MTKWYERKVRTRWRFRNGDRVWLFWPGTTGPHVGKLRARWRGPYEVLNTDVGHDNVLLEHCIGKEQLIAHVSFLQAFHTKDNLLEEEAKRLAEAQDHAAKYRSTRASAIFVEHADSSGEILSQKKVRNASGRPEVRFEIEDKEGRRSWKDVDGEEPPRFGKGKKRMPSIPSRQSGGSLDPGVRARSLFSDDVESVLEDHDDGSRRTREKQ